MASPTAPPAGEGAGNLELEGLGLLRQNPAGGGGLAEIAARRGPEPVEMAGEELEIRSELARRVEAVGVERAERPAQEAVVPGGDAVPEGGDRVRPRRLGPVGAQQCEGDLGQRGSREGGAARLHELGIGEQERGGEEARVIRALQPVAAAVVEIVQAAAGPVEAEDRDRGLVVLDTIGRADGVGQVEAVDLDEDRVAAGDLHGGLALQAVVDREFLDLQAVEPFEIGGEGLEEGELVAFEVLAQGEAEHRLRHEAAGMQEFDPEIDVAVRLRPDAVEGVQGMRGVAGRSRGLRHQGEGGGHARQPQSRARTASGHAARSSP